MILESCTTTTFCVFGNRSNLDALCSVLLINASPGVLYYHYFRIFFALQGLPVYCLLETPTVVIHVFLGKFPPKWAKTILEHFISKEVYKGNASGPTKVLKDNGIGSHDIKNSICTITKIMTTLLQDNQHMSFSTFSHAINYSRFQFILTLFCIILF